MSGVGGSRNPTPPAGRPSSTPTPPQVRCSFMCDQSYKLLFTPAMLKGKEMFLQVIAFKFKLVVKLSNKNNLLNTRYLFSESKIGTLDLILAYRLSSHSCESGCCNTF